VEVVLVCKILMDMSKFYKDVDNQVLLENWLKNLLTEITKIDIIKNELYNQKLSKNK